MDAPYYTITEVARILHRHPNTIRIWCQQGVFPNARKIGRGWYIPKIDIEPEVKEKKEKPD